VPGISRLGRRAGPLGLALTAWDLWRRLPPKQRKQLLKAARRHGPRIVEAARKHGPAFAARLARELDAAARRKKP
jgi:adenine/guanine phosphoribosyltransferase-like PRPP-binding protein